MELSAMMLATVLGPFYLVLGLSHLLYGKVWAKIYKGWSADHLGLVGLMMFMGVFGLIIINMYNVWAWNVWLIVTLSGWGMAVKALAFFLLPGGVLKSWIKMGANTGLQYVAGLILTVIGGVLVYFGYMVY